MLFETLHNINHRYDCSCIVDSLKMLWQKNRTSKLKKNMSEYSTHNSNSLPSENLFFLVVQGESYVKDGVGILCVSYS